MKVTEGRWLPGSGWEFSAPGSESAQLVLAFGAGAALEAPGAIKALGERFPGAQVVGCSTAGEILGTRVSDDTLVAAAVWLEHSSVQVARVELEECRDSRGAGERLAAQLPRPGLRHVFVLSEGVLVNGSELVQGLSDALPATVAVTGGLAADAARFERTLVLHQTELSSGILVAVGFYGDRLRIGCGSLGGWDAFGPERRVTRSSGNVLFELDGTPALDLYKRYLGSYSSELPASGLLFPLSVRAEASARPVVRTINSVDEAQRSMTFAGDVPEGSLAQLMRANVDRLVDGACSAAKTSCEALGHGPAQLAVLISCVGRKLVLKQRTEEEVESVREILGPQASLVGFYSYGEISPFNPSARCEFHNQTMTITTLREE